MGAKQSKRAGLHGANALSQAADRNIPPLTNAILTFAQVIQSLSFDNAAKILASPFEKLESAAKILASPFEKLNSSFTELKNYLNCIPGIVSFILAIIAVPLYYHDKICGTIVVVAAIGIPTICFTRQTTLAVKTVKSIKVETLLGGHVGLITFGFDVGDCGTYGDKEDREVVVEEVYYLGAEEYITSISRKESDTALLSIEFCTNLEKPPIAFGDQNAFGIPSECHAPPGHAIFRLFRAKDNNGVCHADAPIVMPSDKQWYCAVTKSAQLDSRPKTHARCGRVSRIEVWEWEWEKQYRGEKRLVSRVGFGYKDEDGPVKFFLPGEPPKLTANSDFTGTSREFLQRFGFGKRRLQSSSPNEELYHKYVVQLEDDEFIKEISFRQGSWLDAIKFRLERPDGSFRRIDFGATDLTCGAGGMGTLRAPENGAINTLIVDETYKIQANEMVAEGIAMPKEEAALPQPAQP